MSQCLTAQSQDTSANRHQLSVALPASVPSLAPANVPLPLSPVATVLLPHSPVATMTTISDDTPCSYAGVPKLTKLNYPNWAMQIEAYLTGAADHWRVIKGAKTADGSYAQPVPPTDRTSTEWTNWKRSEHTACGVIMATAGELHGELILQNKGKPYDMWKVVEAQHLQQDASLRHDAWMQLLALCKKVDKTYIDFFRRVESTYTRVHCITPKDQTPEKHGQELTLFTILSGLPHNNSLCRSLIAQRTLTLDNTFLAFLHTDAGDQAHAKSANATSSSSRCFLCNSPDHLACDCHRREAINQLVAHQSGNNTGRDRRHKGCGNGNSNSSTQANAANATQNASNPSTSTSTSTSTTNTIGAPTQETAGVATIFLTSSSRLADAWLCDSGASSTMSSDRSAFWDIRPDRHAIHLADGKVVYLEGLGLIRFLSDCGYTIIIHDALFIPHLVANLFASNKFTKRHRDFMSEVTDYPQRKWVNWHTGAMEFMATIWSNNLTYLDWKIATRCETASMSIEEVHAWLNHLPFLAVRRLIQDKSVDGVPDHVVDTEAHDEFCKDCVNGKLS
jgi:hypothetical protein